MGVCRRGDLRLAPNRGAGWFDDVARNATKNAGSNKLVLGHFAREGTSYQKVNSALQGNLFQGKGLE